MKGFNIMTLISSTRFFNGALLAGAMALISTEVAVAQPAPGTADSSGRLVQTWDKTFPRSEKVDHQNIFRTNISGPLAGSVPALILRWRWLKKTMASAWRAISPRTSSCICVAREASCSLAAITFSRPLPFLTAI